MTQLVADQMIYACLERDFSPRQTAGFQTVYWSAGLDESAIGVIENQVSRFKPDQPGRVRHQFFHLPDERLVVTHTTRLRPDREIVDRSGREGTFVAHCIAFGASVFEQFEHDPFAVLDQVEFVTEPEHLIQRFDAKQTHIAPIELQILNDRQRAMAWPEDEVRKLCFLAMVAADMVRVGAAVRLTGSTTEIDQALRLLFRVAPSGLGTNCTFSTWETSPVATGFWAIAGPDTNSSAAAELNCASQRVVLREHLQQKSLFVRWLFSAAPAAVEPIYERVRKAAVAEPLAKILESDPQEASYDDALSWLDVIDAAVAREFFAIAGESVFAKFELRVAKQLSPAVARRLVRYLRGKRQADDEMVVRMIGVAAGTRDAPQHIADWLTDWLGAERRTPSRTDRRRIWILARDTDSLPLQFMAAASGMRWDRASARAALDQLDEDAFAALCLLLDKPIPAERFVCRRHADRLIQQLDPNRLSHRRFVHLVQLLVDAGGGASLGAWSGRVFGVSAGHLKRLERIVTENPDIASHFADALKLRVAEIEAAKRNSVFAKCWDRFTSRTRHEE